MFSSHPLENTPNSQSSVSDKLHASPPAAAATPHPRDGEDDGRRDGGLRTDDGDGNVDGEPAKKKQRRNKPTLSCLPCVERKTKCDRGRPICINCSKRGTPCHYSPVADLIASGSVGERRVSKSRKSNAVKTPASASLAGPLSPVSSGDPSRNSYRGASLSSTGSTTQLLSNVPHTKPTPSNIFGIAQQHPFTNYWTCQGGLAEVVGVLPSKDQADILISNYFESVDPVYPIIDKDQFYLDYIRFWSLDEVGRASSDAALLGLHFAMYALGTQFTTMNSEEERQQSAEFYASAAHQALRISSYLCRTSIRSIQSMVLLCYFLMNDNKASDAWAFAGVLVRQAYAFGLNRNPDIIIPHASAAEKQQRRKVWQAVYFQDTFLTVLLKLPPTATFSDNLVEGLLTETVPSPYPPPSSSNPMSICHIAPPSTTTGPPESQSLLDAQNDTLFIKLMWQLANLVQPTICMPRALDTPVTTSSDSRSTMISLYRNFYASMPKTLATHTPASFTAFARQNPRMAKQSLFLRSNYWHCVMIILAEEDCGNGLRCDLNGAIEACRKAMASFFDLWENFPTDAGVWWVFMHRSFEEALVVARLLCTLPETLLRPTGTDIEPFFRAAKNDAVRVLDILEHIGSVAPDMQKTRTEVLRKAFEAIGW
ncbi:hypothetical protein K402DRAFT_388003 [Aulographum hederae CBS 113979]|uniref:Zn(2)-C6 fungal-type domain-containing protein n=1 Tax=Aulographum hederae CBS 113979 TaxID=1176131 RepID=A0A6G1HH42_9PEZI|nr:hypothetical protein K402DRAFT_388003 [Aulographum hederae CBS 113979]